MFVRSAVSCMKVSLCNATNANNGTVPPARISQSSNLQTYQKKPTCARLVLVKFD